MELSIKKRLKKYYNILNKLTLTLSAYKISLKIKRSEICEKY